MTRWRRLESRPAAPGRCNAMAGAATSEEQPKTPRDRCRSARRSSWAFASGPCAGAGFTSMRERVRGRPGSSDGTAPSSAAAISGETEHAAFGWARLRVAPAAGGEEKGSLVECPDSPATRRASGSTGSRRRTSRLRQGRVLQPGRLGQGPAGAQHHRGGRARRHAEARPDRGRGDQRQHRHRARHGLRRQGLSAGRDHGRQLLDRAAQADALPRRQGGADAAGAEGLGMYQKAKELAEANGWFLARQFETPANADIHEATTAREILGDFEGERLDYFVTGYGTGGTVAGVGRVLRSERPGDQDHPERAGERPARRQRPRAGARRRRRAGREPPGLRAASDPGLDARLHPAGAAGGDRPEVLRRADPDRRAPRA